MEKVFCMVSFDSVPRRGPIKAGGILQGAPSDVDYRMSALRVSSRGSTPGVTIQGVHFRGST